MGLREKSCCFTGHRSLSSGLQSDLIETLSKFVRRLYRKDYRCFLAGGALGFDTAAALAVLRARRLCPEMQLILALPYPGQHLSWPAEEQSLYQDILEKSDQAIYLFDSYREGCFHRRNRYLVDHSSLCLCYLTHTGGGTYSTVQYARKRQIPIVNFAETSDSRQWEEILASLEQRRAPQVSGQLTFF